MFIISTLFSSSHSPLQFPNVLYPVLVVIRSTPPCCTFLSLSLCSLESVARWPTLCLSELPTLCSCLQLQSPAVLEGGQ